MSFCGYFFTFRPRYSQVSRRAEAVKALLTGAAQQGETTDTEKLVSGPHQVVAVLLPVRGCWEAFVAQLGIWKAGAAVVFLDPELPDEVLQSMVVDVQPVAVLTDMLGGGTGGEQTDLTIIRKRLFPEKPIIRANPRSNKIFSSPSCPVLDVVSWLAFNEDCAHFPVQTPRPCWLEDPAKDWATVYFTSGTTNRPKAVLTAHSGYLNACFARVDYGEYIPGMEVEPLCKGTGCFLSRLNGKL